jgi:UDP-N-acetylmuramyl pentapeptide phosphotransferase/UDP-N-acetylglucosamine-1-phosphate transferase
MTTLPFISQATTHLNLAAAQDAPKSASTNSSRTLGYLLLAAAVSAVLVVVNQAMDAWSEDHAVLAWAALWAIGFVAIGLLATPAHRTARSLRKGFAQWREENAEKAEEEKLWELAKHDHRVMAEIRAAKMRNSA